MKRTSVIRPAITLIDRKVATLNQLRAALVKLGKFADSYQPTRQAKRKRKMSAKGKAAIVKAQKARWKRYHKTNGKVLHTRKAS